MKIFMECGREGWWRRLAVLEMGRWAKRDGFKILVAHRVIYILSHS